MGPPQKRTLLWGEDEQRNGVKFVRTTYRTIQGDTWDLIAYKQLGSTDYTDRLISANLEHAGIFLFPAGVTLRLPEIEEKPNANLPPWKR